MSDVRISDLDASGTLLDTDLLLGVNGGQTRKFSLGSIAAYIQDKIVNGVVISATTPPAVVGKHWYSTTTKQLRVYDGSVWQWLGGKAVTAHLVYNANSQTVVDGDWAQFAQMTAVQKNAVDCVNGIQHLASTTPFVKILEAGYYQIEFETRWNIALAGSRGQGIHVAANDWHTDGQTVPTYIVSMNAPVAAGASGGVATTTTYVHASLQVPLSVNDVVTPVVYQNSGAGLIVNSGRFSISLIGTF